MTHQATPKRQFIVMAFTIFMLFPLPKRSFLLSGFAVLATGTNRVEKLCMELGIHDELSLLYEPIIKLLFF